MANEPPFNCPRCGGPLMVYADDVTVACPVCQIVQVPAEVAWRNVLVAESQALQPDGCCSGDTWRGHLCQYHQGFEDGVDVALDRLHSIERMTDAIGDELDARRRVILQADTDEERDALLWAYGLIDGRRMRVVLDREEDP